MAAERTDRIEARVAPDRARRIRDAAALLHTSVSSFVVEAAFDRAEEVLAMAQETAAPSDFFDALVRELDNAPRIVPALRRAVERTTKTVTRR